MYKRVRSSERCGQCHTCLNPSLKQACETVRARQRQQKHHHRKGPDSEERRQKSKARSNDLSKGLDAAKAAVNGSKVTAPAVASASASVLRDTLSRILGPRGGVMDPKYVPSLVSLLQGQTELGPRQVLMTVIPLSSDAVRSELVKGAGVKAIEGWLHEASDPAWGRDPEVRTALIRDACQCLSTLPIDVEALRRTGMGRSLAKLAKSLELPEAAAALRGLVDQWKRLLGPHPHPHPHPGQAQGGAAAGGLVGHKRWVGGGVGMRV